MSDFLFVYGTLRRQSSHPMAAYLAARARFVGDAWIAARLYDLGPYPGILAADSPQDRVHGDLFELSGSAAKTLADLDRYEGCGPGVPPPWQYERKRIEAHLADGTTHLAWVYFYLLTVEETKRMPTGSYPV